MIKLNKVLTLPRSPFYQPVDSLILAEVEKITRFTVSHVKSRELKPDKLKRRFLIEEVYGMMDKR